jgi:LPXTG-motif cell wall-anchored protein
MKTKRGFLRTAWAKFMRANRLPPGNQARSWAVYPRALLPWVTTLVLAQAALTQALGTGADGSSPPASAPAGGENGEKKLEAARAALHGPRKDTAKAKKLLLEVLEQDKATLQPGSLCYVYVYLGYIEDRATNRTQAIAWYKQALALKEGDMIRECAQLGLKEPMTWIRHLDADAGPARQLAQSAKDSVLTTQAETTTTAQTNTNETSRIASGGQETRVNNDASTTASAPSGTAQSGERAPETLVLLRPVVTEVIAYTRKIVSTLPQPTRPAEATEARANLPQTGSSLPLVGLLGLCCVLGAAAFRSFRIART